MSCTDAIIAMSRMVNRAERKSEVLEAHIRVLEARVQAYIEQDGESQEAIGSDQLTIASLTNERDYWRNKFNGLTDALVVAGYM